MNNVLKWIEKAHFEYKILFNKNSKWVQHKIKKKKIIIIMVKL